MDEIKGGHPSSGSTIKGLVNELYLDDLRDKAHRGLTGRALKGMSAGGRLLGYRDLTR